MALVSYSSSSMTNARPGFSYDVFLSFQGEDTRKGFTDHLHTALKQAGIRTFQDDDAMERGKLLKPELNKAIHESAISLIVFSEGYASSKWCLDEVKMIIEEHETSSSKHEVVPVFYKVEPSHVRNQTGSFKEAFDAYHDEIKAEINLEKRAELLEKVGEWRDCLRKAATLTGMVLADGYESTFINNILNVVIKKVDPKALYVEEKLVGIKDDVAEIESWLQDPSPDEVVLLIDGMGGIGKSTIAKCIFNLHFRNYDGSCFLADINKEASNQASGLCRLQSQLLSTISKSEKEEIIWNVDEGTNKITNAISNKKVLLVLDDVATKKQLDALLGPKRFHPGSKVIITTRHKDLETSFTGHPKVHSVETLSMADATELFSMHAFHQHQPAEPHIVLSEPVVHRCKGLPLALKVLGSSLRGKTIDEWEDTMHKLAAIPHPEIQQVLQVSYETLADDNDKEIFLHISCVLEGEEKDYILKVLAGCGLYPVVGIRNLLNRCLLYVDIYGRVMMHQLVKEMGREVVRQEAPKDPGKRSRLWHHHDCIDVLQDHTGTENVEALMLDMRTKKEAKSRRSFKKKTGKRMHGNDANFQIGALEKMKNLMLLQLKNVTFSGKCQKLPKKLRLLSWHGFSLEAIPDEFSLEKLVVLDMSYSRLTSVWYNLKIIESLKILNLSYSCDLIETPDFKRLPALESLIFIGCLSLAKVDKSIAKLKKLVELDLRGCARLRDLTCLPISLVSLRLCGCVKLEVLGSIENLTNLISLDLNGCESLKYLMCLPASLLSLRLYGCLKLEDLGSIENLTKISSLDLTGCESLKYLLCLPTSLVSLTLCGCLKLEDLGSIEDLTKLSYLNLTDCKSLRDLVCLPISLASLNLYGCLKLEDLGSIENLTKLSSLDLTGCESLKHLPCLPTSLASLTLCGCLKLEALGSIENLTKLSYFDLTNCKSLRDLLCLPISLASLNLSGCLKLEDLGSIENLTKLSSLDLTGCESLKYLPCLSTSLASLTLCGCLKLEVLGSIENVTKLSYLNLTNCKSLRDLLCLPISLASLNLTGCLKLEDLGSIENLTKLSSLDLTGCESLKYLPCLPTSLVSLTLCGCLKLEVLGSIENLTKLSYINLTNCKSLRDLLCLPISLASINMSGCLKLEDLGSIENLTKLSSLNLTGCESLKYLPCLPTSLASLTLCGCLKLEVLGSIENLTKLNYFNLTNCKRLRDLLCLPISLASLNLSGCLKLEDLGSIENLTKLSSLDLTGCESLKYLPCLPTSLVSLTLCGCLKLEVLGSVENLTKLSYLNLTNCKSLRDLLCLPISLASINLSGCLKLEDLGSIENLTKLSSLDLTGCESLKYLPCLPTSLVSLTLCGCLKLEVLGSVENLTKLIYLNLTNCKSLRDLMCLPISLASLNLSGCLKLEDLGSIENLTKLRSLDLTGCESLKYLPCLPTSLVSLTLCGCLKLEDLGSIEDLTKLSYLDLTGCESLRDLPCLPWSPKFPL